MNRVRQPRPLVFRGLNVWMGTAAGADELVEIPAQNATRSRYRGTSKVDSWLESDFQII